MRKFFISLLWDKDTLSMCKDGVIVNITIYKRPWKKFDSDTFYQSMVKDGWSYYTSYSGF